MEYHCVAEAAVVPNPDAIRWNVPKAFLTLRGKIIGRQRRTKRQEKAEGLSTTAFRRENPCTSPITLGEALCSRASGKQRDGTLKPPVSSLIIRRRNILCRVAGHLDR